MKRIREYARTGAGFAAAGLGFSIPISVALDNVLLGLMVLLWLASGPRWAELKPLQGNRVVMGSVGLFLICAIGIGYDIRSAGHGLFYLGKYQDLLLLPLFVLLFAEPRTQRAGILAFEIAMLITLATSYLLAMGLLPWAKPFTASPLSGATAFKFQITHGSFMAFAAYLFAERAFSGDSARTRVFWGLASGLAVINTLFMVAGRTGYLILITLSLILFWKLFRMRGLLSAAAIVAIAGALAMSGANILADRVWLAVDQARDWKYGEGVDTSIGIRLNMYVTTSTIIRDNPLFGVGLGGFPDAYAEQVKGTQIGETLNPHNQYLLFAAQLGMIGLASFLAFLWVVGRSLRRVEGNFERAAGEGLLAFMLISCAFNSSFLDHTEGLFFCWMMGLVFAGTNNNIGTSAT